MARRTLTTLTVAAGIILASPLAALAQGVAWK